MRYLSANQKNIIIIRFRGSISPRPDPMHIPRSTAISLVMQIIPPLEVLYRLFNLGSGRHSAETQGSLVACLFHWSERISLGPSEKKIIASRVRSHARGPWKQVRWKTLVISAIFRIFIYIISLMCRYSLFSMVISCCQLLTTTAPLPLLLKILVHSLLRALGSSFL